MLTNKIIFQECPFCHEPMDGRKHYKKPNDDEFMDWTNDDYKNRISDYLSYDLINWVKAHPCKDISNRVKSSKSLRKTS